MGLGARLESGKAGGGFCIKSKSGLLLMSLCLPHSPVLPPSGISTDLIDLAQVHTVSERKSQDLNPEARVLPTVLCDLENLPWVYC